MSRWQAVLKLSHKNLFRVGFVRQVAIALVLAVSLSLISATPAAAQSLGDYFDITYEVSLSKHEIPGSEVFDATVRATATCKEDLVGLEVKVGPFTVEIVSVNEAEITSQVVAQHEVYGTTEILNSSYTITIEPFPDKAGEAYAIEKVIPLQFPEDESSNYQVIGELITAQVKVLLWVDVTDKLPQTQFMGSVTYVAPKDKPPIIAFSPSSFSFTATEGGLTHQARF